MKQRVKYSPELADRILTELADGKTLRSICRGDGMPTHPAVLDWVRENVDDFGGRYAEARRRGYEVMAEQILDLSDETAPENACVAKARLQVDTRKWLLSKALPKVYGDRVALTGDAESPIHVVKTIDATDRTQELMRLYAEARGVIPHDTVPPAPRSNATISRGGKK